MAGTILSNPDSWHLGVTPTSMKHLDVIVAQCGVVY